MSAAILSIGTELTRGELLDTNAAWLSEALIALGIDVRFHHTVDDDLDAIAEAFAFVLSRAELVVCTGGLGPTSDDLTAAAAARFLDVELGVDDAARQQLARAYAKRNKELTELRLKQAERPHGTALIENPVGIAPGFVIARAIGGQTRRAFCLPGVPAEMRAMFQESVVPQIAEHTRLVPQQRHLRVFGMPESRVAERLIALEAECAEKGVSVGYRADFPEVEVKFARAGDPAPSEGRGDRANPGEYAELLQYFAEEAAQRIGPAVYGERDDSLASVVGERLRDARLSLALAESCTGGMVGSLLTEVPGASQFLLFDAVTYSNAAKTNILGVNPDTLRCFGAVSAETAAAMARGVQRVIGADIGVAITGIAGPGGGSEEKPVGTVWFGLAKDGEVVTVRQHISGDRAQVRIYAAHFALDMIRRAIATRTLVGGHGVTLKAALAS